MSDSENLDTLINSVEECLLISDQSQQRSGDTSKPQNHEPLRLSTITQPINKTKTLFSIYQFYIACHLEAIVPKVHSTFTG